MTPHSLRELSVLLQPQCGVSPSLSKVANPIAEAAYPSDTERTQRCSGAQYSDYGHEEESAIPADDGTKDCRKSVKPGSDTSINTARSVVRFDLCMV